MTASVPIWFDDLAVGQVDVAADGSLSLRYADRWLQTAGAFPLSVTMPLRAEPYPSDIISPWLANLLPEEEQLQVLTRSLGLDQATQLIRGGRSSASSKISVAGRFWLARRACVSPWRVARRSRLWPYWARMVRLCCASRRRETCSPSRSTGRRPP